MGNSSTVFLYGTSATNISYVEAKNSISGSSERFIRNCLSCLGYVVLSPWLFHEQDCASIDENS